MNLLTSYFLLLTFLTTLSQGKASDTYKLKAELDLLTLLLREADSGNTETEKVGEALEHDKRELQHVQLRTLSYVSDKRELLEDMAEEIEDDEDLQEEERDALLNNIDQLVLRAGGGCRRKQYTCPGQFTEVPVCLRTRDMCNGQAQCPDGSDEEGSECDAFFANICPMNGRHFCANRRDKRICLPRDKMCDGRQQCADGNDEDQTVCAALPGCDAEIYNNRDGTPRYVSCEGNNECIRVDRWCDGSEECENGADESECEDDILRRQFLHAHNVLRAIHEDTPPVTWNEEVAGRAQLWADYLQDNSLFEHSPSGSEYRMNSGENIYWSSSDNANAVRSINAFYAEEYESEYNYATGTGNGGMIGHFTQVVWDNSITIGCAVARGGGTYVVCQYSPPGNYRGAYPNHVHLPKPGMDPRTVNEELRNSW